MIIDNKKYTFSIKWYDESKNHKLDTYSALLINYISIHYNIYRLTRKCPFSETYKKKKQIQKQNTHSSHHQNRCTRAFFTFKNRMRRHISRSHN